MCIEQSPQEVCAVDIGVISRTQCCRECENSKAFSTGWISYGQHSLLSGLNIDADSMRLEDPLLKTDQCIYTMRLSHPQETPSQTNSSHCGPHIKCRGSVVTTSECGHPIGPQIFSTFVSFFISLSPQSGSQKHVIQPVCYSLVLFVSLPLHEKHKVLHYTLIMQKLRFYFVFNVWTLKLEYMCMKIIYNWKWL